MAFGGQQRDLCALALQQRVGRNRGAVNQPVGRGEHFRARHVQPPRQFIEARHHAERLIRRGRWRFCKYRPPALVRGHEIGVGPADVNADPEHHEDACSAGASVRPCSRSRWRASADRFVRRPPAAAAGRTYLEAIAGTQFDADFLGAQHARLAAFGQQAIMMRLAILAAEHAAGTVARAVARGVAFRDLFRLQHQIERHAEAAAMLAVAAGARAEFMRAEMQGKAHLGDFEAAELQPADRMPFADRRPAVAARRRAAAGPRLEQMPDEILAGARVLALDCDPEPPAPAGHRALRAGRRQRLHDGFDDFIRGMAGAQRHRPARIGPHHRALFRDHLQRPQRAGVFWDLGVDQIGKRHRHRRLHVGVRGVHKAGRLRIGVGQIDLDVAALLGHLRGDADVGAAMAVIVEKRLAVEHAVLPGRDDSAGLLLRRVEDRLDGGFDHRRAEFGKQSRQPPLAEMRRAEHRGEIAAEFAGVADVQRQQIEQVVAQLAGLIELDRRDAQAFLIDLGGGGIIGAMGARRRYRSGARARWSRAAACHRRRPARRRSDRADGCRHDRDR